MHHPHVVSIRRELVLAVGILWVSVTLYLLSVIEEQVTDVHHVLTNNQVAQQPQDLIFNKNSSEGPRIPHRIILIHTKYTAPEQMEDKFYKNVQNTIQIYRDAWNEPEAPVWFLGDKECQQLIKEAEPRLLSCFRSAQCMPHGAWKANVCRLAALWNRGGYYFDVDMQVVKAVLLDDQVDFATPTEASTDKAFFNSFLAVKGGHPIIRKNLDLFVDLYIMKKIKLRKDQAQGCVMLKRAYDALPPSQRGVNFLNLEEINLEDEKHSKEYPDFPRHEGDGCCCNYVVRNADSGEILFYSRIVGAGNSCKSKTASPTNPVIPKYSRASLRSVACQTQDIPDKTTYEQEMRGAKRLENKLKESGRCNKESCHMMCGSESFRLPRLPTGMLLSAHQASAIWCALQLEQKRLGRPANLLVWGLGNDSPFWKSSTTGRVVFIEDNAEWFQKIQKEYELEQYLTKYTSKISRDMSRVGTKEFASEMDSILNQLHLDNETWDVILVDAPMGCWEEDVGRFGPIYSSRKQVDQQGHGHVFVDDFQRRPEAFTSDSVLVDSNCKGKEYCPVKVAVWDRIHPASKRYIEKTALFSFGKSATPESIQILRGLEGANESK